MIQQTEMNRSHRLIGLRQPDAAERIGKMFGEMLPLYRSGATLDSFRSHRPVACNPTKRAQNRIRLKMVDQRIGVHEDAGIRRQIRKVHRSSAEEGKSSSGSIAKYSDNSAGPFQPMSPAVCSANDNPDWTVIRTRSCSPSGKGGLVGAPRSRTWHQQREKS